MSKNASNCGCQSCKGGHCDCGCQTKACGCGKK
jgi:hypothetical protein